MTPITVHSNDDDSILFVEGYKSVNKYQKLSESGIKPVHPSTPQGLEVPLFRICFEQNDEDRSIN